MVRERDRPRYYATLFASDAVRADLFALYGFAAEIDRVAERAGESMLVEIRLQWWRDALERGAAAPGGGEVPALRAVLSAARRHAIPLAALQELIDARVERLEADAAATPAAAEALIAAGEAPLFSLAAAVAGAAGDLPADVVRHAALAYGVARWPGRDQAAGAEPPPALLGSARRSLAAVRASNIPRRAHTVLLPLAIAGPAFRIFERPHGGGAQGVRGMGDLAMLSRIAWAWLRGL